MVPWGKLEHRLDPNYFHPDFQKLSDDISRKPYRLLREIITLSSEFWDQQTGFSETFPYLEISEIDTSTGVIKKISNVPINEAPSRARMVVRNSDILVSTTRPNRGAITLVTENTATPFIASTGFAIIRKNRDELLKSFLYSVLRSRISLRQMEQRSSGGNYPAITPSELKRIKIPVPQKAVQLKVVNLSSEALNQYKKRTFDADALLSSIDDYLISELGILLPPELESTTANRMFRTKASDLGGWRFDARVHQYDFNLKSSRYLNARLATVCAVNPRTVFRGLTEADDVSFVPMDAISDRLGIIERRETRALAENVGYTSFQNGDLLWAKITPCMENGKSAVAQNLHGGFGYGSTEYHVLRSPNDRLDIGYLHALLRMKRVRKAAIRFFTGKSGHQRVDSDFLKTLDIPLPPIDVQRSLAAEARARVARAVQLELDANAELEKAKAEIEEILLGDAA